jgi:hypothetical protein
MGEEAPKFMFAHLFPEGRPISTAFLEGLPLTVTWQLAVFPLEVVTVIVQVPLLKPKTDPLSLTVATDVLELVHEVVS